MLSPLALVFFFRGLFDIIAQDLKKEAGMGTVAYEELFDLKPLDKIHLIDQLLLSLDLPDNELDKIWVEEAEKRIDSYEAGNTQASDVYEVLAKYKR